MRALLVDDERLARRELRRLLAAHPKVEILGEARNAAEALRLIRDESPDVVFLDVQMPGAGGFELLEQLDEPPEIIFTTAYDEYALRAFEVNAVDYLLKPVAPERLAAALARIRGRDRSTSPQVFVRDGDRCWIVRFAEIRLFESDGNYTRLYFRQERPLIPRSLSSIEERLDPAKFFRAGRAQIVNLDWVESVEETVAGSLAVVLRGGPTVEMSRRQSVRLRRSLGL